MQIPAPLAAEAVAIVLSRHQAELTDVLGQVMSAAGAGWQSRANSAVALTESHRSVITVVTVAAGEIELAVQTDF